MSVFCSFCGNRGHNKLGCPHRKAKAAANPDSYLALEVRREAEARRRAIESRSCTYCGEKGHNRRGCSTLKADRQIVINKLNKYRGDLLGKMKDVGLGVGALIQVLSESDPNYKELHLVEKIDWNQLSHKMSELDVSKGYSIERDEQKPIHTRVVSHDFPDNWEGDRWTTKPKIMAKSRIDIKLFAPVLGSDLVNIGETNTFRVKYEEIPIHASGAKIVSPAPKVEAPLLWFSSKKLQWNLAKHYNFQFEKNADPWDKRRLEHRFVEEKKNEQTA